MGGNIQSIPTVFINEDTFGGGGGGPVAWGDVTDKPTEFTPSSHTHALSAITDAGTAASKNVPVEGDASVTQVVMGDDSRLVNARTPTTHTHPQSDITNLTTDLAAKQATLVSGGNIKTINGVPVLGSGDLTVAIAYTLVASLANDLVTGANTNLNNVTGLLFTYAANSVYRIHIYGAVSAAATTTGNGFAFDLSSAVTSIWLQHFHQLANTGTLSGGSSVADAASIGVSSGVPVANAFIPVYGTGLLKTGANTGTAQLQYRSEVAAISTLRAGTTIVVEKIA